MNEYNRICNQCGNTIIYKTKSQFNNAEKHNRICKRCANVNRNKDRTIPHPDVLTKRCNQCGKEHEFSSKVKYIQSKPTEKYLCKSCAVKKAHTGKTMSEQTKYDIGTKVKSAWGRGCYEYATKCSSERWSGENNPMYNSNRTGSLNPFYKKTHTDDTIQTIISKNTNPSNETRLKMRKSAIARIQLGENGEMIPSYNPSSIPIIEAKARELGITDLQHAENGGEYHIKELGYWVDGYSKEKNIVIEYYEPHHKRQVEKDKRRESEITEYLGCKFIIIKE